MTLEELVGVSRIRRLGGALKQRVRHYGLGLSLFAWFNLSCGRSPTGAYAYPDAGVMMDSQVPDSGRLADAEKPDVRPYHDASVDVSTDASMDAYIPDTYSLDAGITDAQLPDAMSDAGEKSDAPNIDALLPDGEVDAIIPDAALDAAPDGSIDAYIPDAAADASIIPDAAIAPDAGIDACVGNIYCQDGDSDGFGNSDPAACIESCSPMEGYVTNSNDCDDSDDLIHPNALEICDGLNNDCDALTDEGLIAPSQPCSIGTGQCQGLGLEYKLCQGQAGWSQQYFNCDAVEGEASEELCDGLDNNCEGTIDETGCIPDDRIVFRALRTGNWEIYTIDPAVGEPSLVNFTNHPAYDESPKWSPDKSQIAFSSGRDGNREIYLMNSDGGNVTRLTENSSWDYIRSWAPSGTQLAFERGSEIYIMNSDGTNQQSISNMPVIGYYPVWSPLAPTLVFYTGSDNVYKINVDGSQLVWLAYGYLPSWSPDGNTIVYVQGGNFMTMDSDGGNQQDLGIGGNHPCFSSDGSKIAFSRDGNIYTVNADGTEEMQITSEGLNGEPDW